MSIDTAGWFLLALVFGALTILFMAASSIYPFLLLPTAVCAFVVGRSLRTVFDELRK